MKNDYKLEILDELIESARGCSYEYSNKRPSIVNDAIKYVKEYLKSSTNEWENSIENISWDKIILSSHTGNKTAWEMGKTEFLDALESIREEIIDCSNVEAQSYNKYISEESPVIFLCHSSKDKKYADAIARFIRDLGVEEKQLVYTSHPLHKIPLDDNIFEYLRKRIGKNTFMIILWSKECLNSPACMNEVGAGWAIGVDYTNVFVPNFDYNDPKFHNCANNPHKKGIVLNGDYNCKTNMIELKDKIESLFGLNNSENRVQFLLEELEQNTK